MKNNNNNNSKQKKGSGRIRYLRFPLLAMILCFALFAGCASSDNDDTYDYAEEPPPAQSDYRDIPENPGDFAGAHADDDMFTMMPVTEDNIFDFVTLGLVRGIEFRRTAPAPVTDQDVDDFIESHLRVGSELVEVTHRPVEYGDVVLIDFVGFIDGVPFQGGAAEGTFLQIGAGEFIEGFEEQIIGRNAGDEFDIYVTFPQDYHVIQLIGSNAVFEVYIYAIFIQVPPVLTDEFVITYLGLDSVEDYRTIIRDRLIEQSIEDALNEDKRQVWNVVVETATVHRFPVWELEHAVEQHLNNFREVADSVGADLETFIVQSFNIPFDDFILEYIGPGAMSDVSQDLILRAVAVSENIFILESELEQILEELAEEFDGQDDSRQINEERVIIALLADAVIERLMEHAIAVG